jgi:methyl-accepting chemotaxis protein
MTNDGAIHVQRAFGAAVIFTMVAFTSVLLSVYLIFIYPVWQVALMTAIAVLALVLDIISIVLIRQHRAGLGLKVLYWSGLFTVPANVVLFTGIAPVLIALVLVVGFVEVFLLFPANWRKYSPFGPLLAALVMLLVEFLNPSFRFEMGQVPTSGYFGQVVLGFVIISTVVLVVRQSWSSIRSFMQSSIRNRLTTIVVGSAIIPVLLVSFVLGWATYVQVRSALTQDAFDKLAAVQNIKSNQIKSYLAERRNDMEALSATMGSLLTEAEAKMDAINILKRDQIVRLFQTWDADVRDVASDPGVVAGIRDLEAGFQETGSAQVRSLYLGQETLQIADDGSNFSSAHLEQHGFFSGYTAIHGYLDAFLIDPAGNVVYSVHKTDVFGSNLTTGAYKDSNLARLYQNLMAAPTGKTYIADVALFEGKYAMFIGTPIYNGSKLEGILAYQLPLDVINSIMKERTGQGITGDSYLIALEEDNRVTYRSDRTIVGNGEYVIGYDLTDIAPQFMRDALGGTTGGQLVIGSVGEAVVNAYRPLEVTGLRWAVLSRVTAAEALSPTHLSTGKDFLTTYKENYGYYDIFLIEPHGYIFYTVAKEADYRTNILTGEYSDTGLGELVKHVSESRSFDLADFTSYAPSNGEPAGFFGIPVLDADNNIQMIVAAQISLDQINAITGETTGLGESGETYLVGPDQLWRSNSRFLADLGVETTVLNEKTKVDTIASRSALAGEVGQEAIPGYRGLQVLSVWSPLTVITPDTTHGKGLVWALIADIDESEALAPVNALAGTLGLVIGLAVLIAGTLASLAGARFATQFVTPILSLTNTAAQVAAGNMSLTVQTDNKDELGTLSNAFNSMTTQLREFIGSLEQRVAARTKDLATVAEVGTATATILETDRLLQAVVDLTKERFELYHSHIYLLDEAGQNLVLAAGAGEPGRIMAAEKRSIPLSREQSLVARAAREQKGVIVNDVTQAPDFLPNPLLPDTRSELAVPMIVGGRVIGVFDVQSDQVGRFTDADINIQTTLAAQVSTSIQNVRSFEQSRAQAELEALVNSIGQKIQRAATVDDTLQIAIREIGVALGAARVTANIGQRPIGDDASGNN